MSAAPVGLDGEQIAAGRVRMTLVAEIMRYVDAYAYDYKAEGKLAKSRRGAENALLSALSASRQEGWQPIADAPEGVLLVVGWLDPEDDEHPERHDFDYLADGVWQKHSENVEYFQLCAPAGSRGPREQAPYTHFMPVASIPAAPHQAQEAQGDRHGE